MLTKYTNSDYPGNLKSWQIRNDGTENYHTVAFTANEVDYDIVTIRARYNGTKGLMGIGISEVLDELDAAGYAYTDIYCAFCRGGKPDPAG